MIRHAVACLLAIVLAGLGFAADDPKPAIPDEPPALLKKKKKPMPEEKPAPKEKLQPKDDIPKEKLRPKDKDGEPDDTPESGTDAKEVLERITKNIRNAEERLRKKDASEGTRQVQRDVVKDIDKLIERMQQQQNQQSSDSSSSSSSSSEKTGSQQQPSSESKSRRGERERRGKRDSKSNSQAKQDGSGKQGGAGRDSSGAATPKAESFKDIWGHYPEKLRMELDAYSREQFAAKYGDLLKQYYQKIAEKGRRPENER